MNWNDLSLWISTLTPEQRETDVTIYDGENDEYHPVCAVDAVTVDVLDENHPIIII